MTSFWIDVISKNEALDSNSEQDVVQLFKDFRLMILTDTTRDACSELFDELKLVTLASPRMGPFDFRIGHDRILNSQEQDLLLQQLSVITWCNTS